MYLQRSDKKEDGFEVPWSDVVRIAGHHMKRVADLVPPRWSVESFPTPAELDALLAAGGTLERAGPVI